jgi:hypothetical protein
MNRFGFKACQSVVALVGFVILTALPAVATELSTEELSEIAQVGKQLLRAYPAPDTVFIGVGQSPQVILAYLESQVGKERAYSLPISGTRNLDLLLQTYKMNDRLGDFMRLHIEHFISPKIFRPRQTYVVFDFSTSGASMQASRQLFAAAFAEMNLNPNQLRFVALKSRHGKPEDSAHNADLVLSLPKGLDDRLLEREYRHYHPYSKLYLMDLFHQYLGFKSHRSSVKLFPSYSLLIEDSRLERYSHKKAELVQLFVAHQKKSALERCWNWLSPYKRGRDQIKASANTTVPP